MKITLSCLTRRAGLEHVLFDLRRSISTFNRMSGQVMTQVGQCIVCTYLPWRVNGLSHLAPFARLYLHSFTSYWRKTYRDLFSSGDLHVTPDHQLHPDHHRWGKWPWFWKNWVVLVGLCETGSIFIVPHRFMMGRSRNWPDLRSPG